MALVIDYERNGLQQKTWEFNTQLEMSFNDKLNIVQVSATGPELKAILNMFKYTGNSADHYIYSIPYVVGATSQVWYGDIAKTIVGNLAIKYNK